VILGFFTNKFPIYSYPIFYFPD
jgi:hypothetical protein